MSNESEKNKNSFLRRLVGKEDLAEGQRKLILEQLEARILYSAAPVDAEPAQGEAEAQVSTTGESAPEVAETATDSATAIGAAEQGEVAEAIGGGVDLDQEVVILGEEATSDEAVLSTAELAPESVIEAPGEISASELEPLVEEAISRWQKVGLTAEQTAALSGASYEILDLGGNLLGATTGQSIVLDDDASGLGWFVDLTPDQDEEYSLAAGVDPEWVATSGSAAEDRIDLLSVLMHEQGHILGLYDLTDSALQADIMYGIFEAGERRIIEDSRADGAEALSLQGTHYATVNATWSGGGDGTSWNDAANWAGTAPSTLGTLTIDTAATINNVFLDGTTGTYNGANTFRGTVNLNQGTIEIGHYFGTGGGANGSFNIGDGSGTDDAIVNITNGGDWQLDRHSTGTFTVNINSDGQLNATGTGKFTTYPNSAPARNWIINVNGGSLSSEAAWDLRDTDASVAPNFVNISNGGTVSVERLTVAEDVFDFADNNANNSLTATFGGSFADIDAVNAAIGTTFTSSGGDPIFAHDNGDGTFSLNYNAPPVFVGDTDSAANSINENALVDTPVGITVSFTDPESAPVTYSLSDDAGGRFKIDASTGEVTVANPALISFASATSHDITVLASDGTTGSSTQDFTIAVTLPTWTGAGDGTSWNDGANWGGTAPGQTGTLVIDTTDTITNVYLDTGTSTYSNGATFRGTANLNQGTIEIDHYFGTGPSGGGFNIGDGSGTDDAIVNIVDGGTWEFDRHSGGTYTVNILSDGQLNATGTGKFQTYANTDTRQWVINVDGGKLTSEAAWNMRGSGADDNQINLSNGATANVGAITLTNTEINFSDADVDNSFTASFGGSFADIAAVQAAVGTTFTSTNGLFVSAADNGDGTFSLTSSLPSITSTDIVDTKGGGPILAEPVTVNFNFSHAIDLTTVTEADFSNAGTAAITFDSITQDTPGVISVTVTPGLGDLQMQINAGAVISDLGGNSLDTAAAIVDDTTISVVANFIPVAVNDTNSATEAGGVNNVVTTAGGDGSTASGTSGTVFAQTATEISLTPPTTLIQGTIRNDAGQTTAQHLAGLTSDSFVYDPLNPTTNLPNQTYNTGAVPAEGIHGSSTGDLIFELAVDSPVTLNGENELVVDLYGRNSNGDRDNDFDVLFMAADGAILGQVTGQAINATGNHHRVSSAGVPAGSTIAAIRIVAHDSDGNLANNNSFTLMEVRAAELVGDNDADPTDQTSPHDGSVNVTNIAYSGTPGTQFSDTGSGPANAGGAVSGATAIDGQYGTLTIDVDGTYTYLLDDDASDPLTGSDVVNEVFTYTIEDGNEDGGVDTATATLTIAVTGVDDLNIAPIAADDTNTAVEAGGVADSVTAVGGDGTTVSGTSGTVFTQTGTELALTAPTSLIQGAIRNDGGQTTEQHLAGLNSDSFTYDPLDPTSDLPTQGYSVSADPAQGIHGSGNGDIIFELAINTPVTINAENQVVVDLYGRGGTWDRDDDIDVLFMASDGTTVLGQVTGQAITSSQSHVRVSSLGVVSSGAEIAAIRIVGHDSDSNPAGGNAFTLMEVRAAELTGDADANDSDQVVPHDGSVNVSNIAYSGAATQFSDTGGGPANAGGAVFGATAIDGQYGTLTINPDGTYTYLLDAAAADPLTSSDVETEEFTYTIEDGNEDGGVDTVTAKLTISVTGADDINTPPVAIDDTNSATEAGGAGNTIQTVGGDGSTLSGTSGTVFPGPGGELTLQNPTLETGINSFGGSLEGTLNDTFAYDYSDPTGVLPSLTFASNAAFHNSGVGDATIRYELASPITVDATTNIVVDLYGRGPGGTYANRDNDIDIQFLDASNNLLGEVTGAAIGINPNHVRVSSLDASLANGAVVAKIQVIGHDSDGDTSSNNAFTLQEIRAALLSDGDVDASDSASPHDGSINVTNIAFGGTAFQATNPGGAVSAGTTSADGTLIDGAYGTLTIGADGTYTYLLDSAASDSLTSSDVVTEVFTYTIDDGNEDGGVDLVTADLTITVTGADDVSSDVLYVDASWSALNLNDRIDDADSGVNGDQLAFFGGNAFATIGDAIAAAGTGDTIIVNAGTYAETVTLDDGKTLEVTGPDSDQAVSISELSSDAGTSIVIEGGSTLTINNAANQTIAGTISGSGSLVKDGAGELTLGGDNTYSGTTTVSGGTLFANGTHVGSPIATSEVVKVAWDQTDQNDTGTNIRGAAEIAAQERGDDSQLTNQGVSYLKFDLSGLTPAQVNDPNFSAIFSIEYDGRVNGTQNMEVGMRVVDTTNTWSDTVGDYPLATWVAPANGGSTGSPLSADYILIDNVLTTTPTGQAILLDATADVQNWVNGTINNNGYVIFGTYDTFQGADFSNATLLTSAGYTVENNATLGGTGSVSHSVTVDAGGTLAPGTGGIGTLTIENNLTLDGNLAIEVNDVTTAGTDFDQLVVNGAVTLGATAALVPTGTTATTGDLTIVANDRSDAVTGTFSGLDDGDTITINGQIFEVGYSGDTDSNDIVLRAPQTTAVVDGSGNLVVTDIETDSADTITVSFDSGTSEYVVSNTVNGFEARIAQSSVTGGLIVQSAFGADETTDINADTVIIDSDLTFAGPITITADAITLNGNLATTVGDINLNGDVTLSKAVTLEASEAGLGDVIISGAANLAGGQLLLNVTGADSEILGEVSGTSLRKEGGGTLTLSQANTYTGGTSLNDGVIVVTDSAALGTGTVTTPSSGVGGDLVIGANGLNIANQIFVRNEGPTKTIRFAVDGINSATLSGRIQLHETNAGQFAIEVGEDDTLTFTGDLFFTGGGGAGLTKSGTGTLIMSNSNVYNGPTTVAAGTLLINGDHSGAPGAVSVQSGATLGGTGTIVGAVTIDNGGTLAPGNNGIGQLTINNDLVLNGELSVEVNGVSVAGTDFDQVVVNGTVTLGANSGLVTSGTTSANGVITIVANNDTDLVGGTFSGVPEGSAVTINGQEFAIGYNGDTDSNDIVLGLPETTVEVDVSGNLVVTDVGTDSADTITISLDTGTSEYVVTNTFGAFEARVAQASVTGGLIVQTAFTDDEGTDANSDTVIIDEALSFAGPVTITADAMQLGGNLTTSVGDIVLNGDVTLTENVNLEANEASVGDVIVNGGINLTNRNLTITNEGTDGLISGVISGTGGLSKSNDGTLTLAGANTYTGTTNLNNGVTRITDGSAFGGSGLVNIQGAINTTTILELGADGLTVTNPFFIRNNGSFKTIRLDEAGTNSATLTGNFTHHEDRPGRFLIDVGEDDSLTLSGNLAFTVSSAGDAGITKNGDGTLILSGSANSYNGLTTVAAGTLLVNGDNSGVGAGTTVSSTGVIGGTGTIGNTVTVESGGTLSPGVGGVGTLTVNDLVVQGQVDIDLNGSTAGQFDVVTINGTLDLTGATLNPVNSLAISTTDSITLLDNVDDNAGDLTGTFTGLAEGATVTVGGQDFTVTYANGDVTLVPVTETIPEVYLNEILVNPDVVSDNPNEYLELRGTPSESLDGVYLMFVEGDDVASQGSINGSTASDLIDLSTFALGTNGLLVIRDPDNPNPVAPGTTLVDIDDLDFENGSFSALLVHVSSTAAAPTGSQNLDTNDDGELDLPTGWTVIDSIGYVDGTEPAARGYGAITFAEDGDGTVPSGANQVSVNLTNDDASLFLRIGDSTGSTGSDWVAIRLDESSVAPNFVIQDASDANFQAGAVATSHLGESNPTSLAPPLVTAANVAISGATGTSGAFKVGDTVSVAWDNTASGENNPNTITGVTVDFSEFAGGGAVAAINSGDTWTATFTLVEGSLDAANLNVTVTVTDENSSTASANTTTDETADNQSPTVTDANISVSGDTAGAFGISDVVTVQWDSTTDGVADLVSVTVDFSEFGGGNAVAATDIGSGIYQATYTIVTGSINVTDANASVTVTDDAGNVTTTADGTDFAVNNQVTTTEVRFAYTQTDSTTGSGTITGDLNTSSVGGPGVLTFTADLPLATLNQKDTTTEPIPAGMVGVLSTGNNNGTHGVHLGWDQTVTMRAFDNGVLYTIEVPLVDALSAGNSWAYSVNVTDDNSSVGGTNDLDGSFQLAGWFGDDGSGHRHTQSGTQTYAAGSSTHTISTSGALGPDGEGDNAGITVGMRAGFSGVLFVDQVDVEMDLTIDQANIQATPLADLAAADAFTVAEDGSLVASDTDGSVTDVASDDGSFDSVLVNDFSGLTVASVQGTDLSGGTVTVDTDRGGSVTVLSDGTFTYSQNGALNGLDTGEQGTDTFTYTGTYEETGTLVGYDLNSDFTPTNSFPGYTITDLTGGAGLSTFVIDNPASAYATNVVRTVSSADATPTLAEAITGNDYIEFSVTPAAGDTLNLSELSFDTAKGGGSARGIAVMASLDGGVTGFTDGDELLKVDNVPTVRSLTHYDVDLSSLSPTVDQTITFRIYQFTTSGSMEFDNIALSGTGNLASTGTVTITVDGANEQTTENASLATDIPHSSNPTLVSATDDGDSSPITLTTATVTQAGDQITFDPGTDFDGLNVGETATVVVSYESEFALIDIQPDGARAASGSVSIDESLTGANLQNGFDLATGTLTSNFGDEFTIAIDDTDASGADVGGIDWRDRGDSTAADPLVQVGEDLVKNNNGIIRVTLDNLPAGTYSVTSYHTDPGASQSEAIKVLVDNGNGSGFVDTGVTGDASVATGTNSLTDATINATAANFTITSDGTNPVILLFDGSAATDTEVPLNGLRLYMVEDYSISVTGENDAPVTVADTNSVTETVDAVSDPQVTGNVLTNDTDPEGVALNVLNAGTQTGTYGSLELLSDGSYTYTLDDANAQVDGLNVSETLTDTFTYTVSEAAPAQWGFTGGSASPSTQGTGFTASDITAGVGLAAFAPNEVLGYASAPVLRVNPLNGTTSLDAAVTADSYIEFTVTPDTVLDLDTLEFDIARGGGSQPRGWGIRSSVDGFTSNVDTADVPTQRPNFTNVSVDLSGAEFQNLTSPVTFRIYVYTPSSGSSLEFDNITLNPKSYDQTLEITVDGANDSPVLVDDTNSVTETADAVSNPQATGNVLTDGTPDSDVDSTLTVSNDGTLTGDYGTLTLNSDGSYTYTLDDANTAVDGLSSGESLTDSFLYRVSDGAAAPSDVAIWDFTGGSSGPTTQATGFTASSISQGAGLTIFNPNANDGYSSAPVLHLNPPNGASNIDDAVTANSYVEFTVTPTEFTSLEDLTFDVAKGGSGTRGWGLRSSLDGFAANIDTADVPTTRPNFTNFTADLSGAEFQNLTSAVTFRLYIYAPTSGNSLEFDNITLNASTPHAANLDITINGTNDTPVVAATADTNLSETTDTSNITGNITVNFTDVDLTDTGHATTITAASTSGVTSGLTLDETALRGLISVDSTTKNSGSNSGSAALSFSAASTAFDYLADGETLTITYTASVSDGDAAATNTFDVIITGTNDGPSIAQTGPLAVTMSEDSSPTAFVAPIISATDVDGSDTLTWSVASGGDASNGSLSVSGTGANPTITYSPDANYNGSDSFTVQVSDGTTAETIVVNVTIDQIDDVGAFGGNTSGTSAEDNDVTGTLSFTDAADGASSPGYTVSVNPSNGSAGIDASGNWTYTPTANFHGNDSFTVSVNDDGGNPQTQLISVTVTPVNDPGTFGGNTSGSADEGSPVTGTLTFTDVADGAPSPGFNVSVDGANGSAAIDAGGNWTWTPTDPNFSGTDSFTVEVTDGDGNTETKVIGITANPVPGTGVLVVAETSLDPTVGVAEDLGISFTSGDPTDADEVVTVTITGIPTGTTIEFLNPALFTSVTQGAGAVTSGDPSDGTPLVFTLDQTQFVTDTDLQASLTFNAPVADLNLGVTWRAEDGAASQNGTVNVTANATNAPSSSGAPVVKKPVVVVLTQTSTGSQDVAEELAPEGLVDDGILGLNELVALFNSFQTGTASFSLTESQEPSVGGQIVVQKIESVVTTNEAGEDVDGLGFYLERKDPSGGSTFVFATFSPVDRFFTFQTSEGVEFDVAQDYQELLRPIENSNSLVGGVFNFFADDEDDESGITGGGANEAEESEDGGELSAAKPELLEPFANVLEALHSFDDPSVFVGLQVAEHADQLLPIAAGIGVPGETIRISTVDASGVKRLIVSTEVDADGNWFARFEDRSWNEELSLEVQSDSQTSKLRVNFANEGKVASLLGSGAISAGDVVGYQSGKVS